jgi:chromosome segregation protein
LGRLEQEAVHGEMTQSEYHHNVGLFELDIQNWKEEIKREESSIELHRVQMNERFHSIKGLESKLAQDRQELNSVRSELEQREIFRKQLGLTKEEFQEKLQEVELERQRLKHEVDELAQVLDLRYSLSIQEVLSQMTSDVLERLEDPTVLGALEVEAKEWREKLESFGEVNLLALTEFEEIKKRLEFMHNQQEDLLKTLDALQSIIDRINKITEFRFYFRSFLAGARPL